MEREKLPLPSNMECKSTQTELKVICDEFNGYGTLVSAQVAPLLRVSSGAQVLSSEGPPYNSEAPHFTTPATVGPNVNYDNMLWKTLPEVSKGSGEVTGAFPGSAGRFGSCEVGKSPPGSPHRKCGVPR